MGRIVVFGGGGRAGRAAIGEARRRGHRVTAVVRDPGRHTGLISDGVATVAGDVTDPDSVATAAAEHDAAISAVYDPAAPAGTFYIDASRALLSGLAVAGVPRLIVVGLAAVLPTDEGVPLMDLPGYPQQYRSFYLGHAAGLHALRTAGTAVDWLVVSPTGDFHHGAAPTGDFHHGGAPTGDFHHGGAPTGRYRVGAADPAGRIPYADLAVALLDEIDTPTHHRTHLGVEAA